MASTINAYSTKSWPCSSLISRKNKCFILFPLVFRCCGFLRRSSLQIVLAAECVPDSLPKRRGAGILSSVFRYYCGLSIQLGEQPQISCRRRMVLLIAECDFQFLTRIGVPA